MAMHQRFVHTLPRVLALLLALGGLGACAGEPAVITPAWEVAFREDSRTWAVPEAQRQPYIERVARRQAISVFRRIEGPEGYRVARLETGIGAPLNRQSQVLDDIERAVVRLEQAEQDARRLVAADRARIAVLAQAFGQGRQPSWAPIVRERARANYEALAAGVLAARDWGAAYRRTVEELGVLSPALSFEQNIGLAPGPNPTVQDALERFEAALDRLEALARALRGAVYGLPGER